jgi:hypothetical protein
MHKEEFADRLLAYAKYLQENKATGTEPIFTDNNMGEESKMSDAQMKKREKIVMSMKDKTSYFKKKYGAKWKNVMYATATKQAMGEELNYEEQEDIHQIVEDDDKITTDMLRGRVKGGESNDLKSFKVKMKVGLEKPAPEHVPGEDSKAQQNHSTNPGPVDIKFDDKLVSPTPYTYFSKNKQVKYEEVELDEDMKSFAKKAFKALTGGSDKDQRKDLQRKMGIPQTGKKPVQKEDIAVGGSNDPVHKHGVRGELKSTRSKEAKQHDAELNQFKKDHAPGKLVHKEEKVSPSDTAKDVASKTFNKLRKETMMGKISN